MLSLQSGAVVIEQKILLILCGEIMEQTKELVTSYGEGKGYKMGGEGHVQVYPYKKGWRKKL